MDEFNFPFTPYPQQVQLMRALHENIKNAENGVYESPTGTGKSLVILSVLKKYLQQGGGADDKPPSAKEDCTKGSKLPSWIIDHFKQIQEKSKQSQKAQTNQLKHFLSSVRRLPPDTITQIQDYVAQLVEINNTDGAIDSCVLCGQLVDIICGRQSTNHVIYSSRTHTQLQQFGDVVKQNSPLQTVTVASRQLYCIDAHADGIEDIDLYCQNNKDNCYYKKQINILGALIKYFRSGEQNMSVQDFKARMREYSACPYYTSRAIQNFADISLETHQQLLNIRANTDLGDEPGKQLIIIDECHNLVELIHQNNFQVLKLSDLIVFLMLLGHYIQSHQKVMDVTGLRHLNTLLDYTTQVLRLFRLLEQQKLQSLVKDKLLHQLKQLKLDNIITDAVHFFRRGNFVHRVRQQSNQKMFYDTLRFVQLLNSANIADFILSIEVKQESFNQAVFVQKNLPHFLNCTNLTAIYDALFAQTGCQLQINIRPFLIDEKLLNSQLELQNLQPHFDFNGLGDKLNIHMLGGTVSPFSSFQKYFDIKLGFQQFGHVIDSKQLAVQIVTKLGNIDNFKFTFQSFGRTDIHDALLGWFLQVRRNQLEPHQNMIVFLPNYHVLGMFKQLVEQKRPEHASFTFEQPRAALQEIHSRCKQLQSHILFAVTNGSLAEGIDFRDDLCRVLVVLGIPFPNMQSQFVKEKTRIDSSYAIEKAFQAVNQCIGRCIRWRGDWSRVILADSRYKDYFDKYLSKWIINSGYKEITW